MASTSTSTSRRPGNPPQPPSRPHTRIDPFVPNTDHNPRELKSWAKRTGFISTFSSGESLAAPPPPPPASRSPAPALDLEKGLAGGRRRRRRLDIASILGRREKEHESDDVSGEIADDGDKELGFGGGGDVEERRRRRRRRERNGEVVMRNWKEEEDEEDEEEKRVEEELVVMARKGKSDNNVATNGKSGNNKNNNNNMDNPINGNGVAAKVAAMSVGVDREKKQEEEEEVKKKEDEAEREQVQVGLFADEFLGQDLMERGGGVNLERPLGLKCDITENPGWGKSAKSVCISNCLVEFNCKTS